MSPEPKIIQCGGCGQRMSIPPQYANMPGKCPRCGARVNDLQGPRLDGPELDVFDIDTSGIEMPDLEHIDVKGPGINPGALDNIQVQGMGLKAAGLDQFEKRPKPVSQRAHPPKKPSRIPWRRDPQNVLRIVRAMIPAFLLGCAGALAGGALVAAFMKYVFYSDAQITISMLVTSADFGLVIGFSIGFGWVLVKLLELEPAPAAIACSFVTGILGVTTHILEVVFVAPSDVPLWGTAAASFFGGAVLGLFLGFVEGPEADE